MQSVGTTAEISYRVDPYLCKDCNKTPMTRIEAYRQTLPTVAAKFWEETQESKNRWSNLSAALQVYDFLPRPATRWSAPTIAKMEQAILLFLSVDDFFKGHLRHSSNLRECIKIVQGGHFKCIEEAHDHVATTIHRAFLEKEQALKYICEIERIDDMTAYLIHGGPEGPMMLAHHRAAWCKEVPSYQPAQDREKSNAPKAKERRKPSWLLPNLEAIQEESQSRTSATTYMTAIDSNGTSPFDLSKHHERDNVNRQ